MTVAPRITLAEYMELEGPRGTNLVDGEVIVNEPRSLHQEVLADLLVALRLWTRNAAGRGQALLPIDVELDDHNCFAPDVLCYEEHGLPELWLVDTAADEILIFRRSQPKATTFDVCLELARGDTLSSPLLPDFALALDELFGER